MGLPAPVMNHHTAWVALPGSSAHPVRYAVEADRLVCFGDELLAHIPNDARVSVSIHEIAGGQLLAEFAATLHTLTPEAVGVNALAELLDHVPLGRTLEEVEMHLAGARANRRIVELVP